MAAPKLASVENLKVPPHSIESEQAVLGGLLLSARAWEQVADVLSEPDFYREDHRLIFRSIHELSDVGKPCDAVTVTEWFESRGKVDLVDGGAYISQLAGSTPSAANVKAYADIVRENAVLRALITVGNDIAGSAFVTEGRSSGELLEHAEQQVFQIAERGKRGKRGFRTIRSPGYPPAFPTWMK